MRPEVVWQAQPGPQTALLTCPVFEIFYGGARGGGKTDGMLGEWLQHSAKWGKEAIGVFFRREYTQLSEVIARSKILFVPLGAKFNEQKAEWTMPNGARLLFRHLDKDKDAEKYQGHNYTRVYIEEVTNFPLPGPIDKLRATLRAREGIDVGLRLTGNPGGPGHSWVKQRYIDPAPLGYQVLSEDFVNPFTAEVVVLDRVFIPAKVIDNKKINQAQYIAQLQQAGSEQLVRGWLLGDWSIIDGAFFECFNPDLHVLRADSWMSQIRPGSPRFRAFDWGSAKPFCCGWYAINPTDFYHEGRLMPKGALIKYREWYGSTGKPNVGLKLDASVVAEGVKAREANEIIRYGVSDPAIFIRDGGPSIMEMFTARGVQWRRADNKRVPGWAQMRYRLIGEGGVPMIYFMDNCIDTIRTLPLVQHDDNDPEDLDTEGEDHAVDETRYACMSRPWVPKPTIETSTLAKLPQQYTINDLIEMLKRRHKREGVTA